MHGAILRQNSSGSRDARIVTRIAQFKAEIARSRATSLTQARLASPARYDALLAHVEQVLIEMPLPRLQLTGRTRDEFLYRIGWDTDITGTELRRYFRGQPSTFDNRILLGPGIAEALAQLNGVLRPLIQQSWTLKVAQLNHLQDAELHDFLFGEERAALQRVRAPLVELQRGRCFLCQAPFTGSAEVDHFLPWARVPLDNLENLVAAHPRCNQAKRDFLPALTHVDRWAGGLRKQRVLDRIEEFARKCTWPSNPPATLGVARSIYRQLPENAMLWLRTDEFVERGSLALSF
jgi:5-methylcytosine-specific restriction endonuclease McrA